MAKTMNLHLNKLLAYAIVLGCFTLSAMAVAQTIYKSVDADGKIVYSDKAPRVGHLEKTLKFQNAPGSELPASASSYVEQLKRMHARNASPAAVSSGVVLYSTSWCGYCKRARGWLSAQGIAYQDVDVETPSGLAAFADAGGGRVIPVVQVGGRSLRGFTPELYAAFFGAR